MKKLIWIITLFFISCTSHVDKEQDRSISSRKRAATYHIVSGFGNEDCLADAKKSDLKNLSVNLKGAKSKEKKIVNEIMSSIVDLAGDKHSKVLVKNININFKNYLRQRTDGHCLPGNFGLTTRGAIDLARKCHPKSPEKNLRFDNDHLRGSLIHEIGHVVGNKRYEGKTFYQHYNKKVKSVCKVSKYTTHSNAGNKHRNRNEEFAEVWAAYIWATDRLKSKCRKAHNFMKDFVFNDSSHRCRALKK